MLNFMLLYYSSSMLEAWMIPLLFIGCILGFFIIIMVGGSISYARKVKFRATAEPLCSWEYSASEWRHYADIYKLSKKPKGLAKVKITPLDIWIADDSKNVRQELDENLKCVMDCRFENNVLKMRVLWFSRSGKGAISSGASDFQLPVPVGKEEDVSKVVEFFKKNKAENNKKVALITRFNHSSPLFGGVVFGQIRLTLFNFLAATAAYSLLTKDLISGPNIFSSK